MMTSQVGTSCLKRCGTVLRIQWYLQWVSSSIRSEVMVAQRTRYCSGWSL